MNTPAWNNQGAPSASTRVSPQNFDAYITTASGDLVFFDNNSGTWTPVQMPTTDPFVGVAASPDGAVIAVTNTGQAFMNAFGFWGEISSSFAILQATVGDVDNFILSFETGTVQRTTFGSVDDMTTVGGPTKVSATPGLGNIWGINATGTVYRWNGSSWTIVPGKLLKQIDIFLNASGKLQVVGVDASGNGWVYDALRTSWTAITFPTGTGAGVKFAWLETSNNQIWAVLTNGAVYRGTF